MLPWLTKQVTYSQPTFDLGYTVTFAHTAYDPAGTLGALRMSPVASGRVRPEIRATVSLVSEVLARLMVVDFPEVVAVPPPPEPALPAPFAWVVSVPAPLEVAEDTTFWGRNTPPGRKRAMATTTTASSASNATTRVDSRRRWAMMPWVDTGGALVPRVVALTVKGCSPAP